MLDTTSNSHLPFEISRQQFTHFTGAKELAKMSSLTLSPLAENLDVIGAKELQYNKNYYTKLFNHGLQKTSRINCNQICSWEM